MNLLNPHKICSVIITYNPDHLLLDIINIIENQVDKIIIIDNNSEGQGLEIISKIAENHKLCLLRNKENGGIAKALNQGVELAKKMDYEWALTFDQDTKPFDNIIEIISEVYALYSDKQKIGAIGVNFSNFKSESYYPITGRNKYHERDYIITSGCLLSVNAFYKIGGFREDFFIDNVDLEYSLRLKRYGKVSLITKKWGMSHKVGDPRTKRCLGLNLVSSNHTSLRRYYMARNHIILSKDYFFINPYFIGKANFFFLKSLIQILLVETNKKAKIIASLKGIIDGIFYSAKYKKIL